MARENWKRSYKIIIGTPERKDPAYYTNAEYRQDFNIPEDQLTIPSNAIKLSNLAEDDKLPRGFTFTFDGNISAGNSKASGSEMSRLRLYNLNQDQINVIEQKDCVVRVYAGYNDKVDLAYAGDVSRVIGKREGNDYVYDIDVEAAAADFKSAILVANYLEDKSVKEVIRDLVSRFPTLALGASDFSTVENLFETGGFSYQGNLVDALQYFIDKYNLTLGVQNGKIFISPYKIQSYADDFIFSLGNNYNLTSDLIKDIQPVQDNKSTTTSDNKETGGVSISTFFLPAELNQFFTVPKAVENTADRQILTKYAGTYKIEKIRIKLESHGNFWDVNLTGKRI